MFHLFSNDVLTPSHFSNQILRRNANGYLRSHSVTRSHKLLLGGFFSKSCVVSCEWTFFYCCLTVSKQVEQNQQRNSSQEGWYKCQGLLSGGCPLSGVSTEVSPDQRRRKKNRVSIMWSLQYLILTVAKHRCQALVREIDCWTIICVAARLNYLPSPLGRRRSFCRTIFTI